MVTVLTGAGVVFIPPIMALGGVVLIGVVEIIGVVAITGAAAIAGLVADSTVVDSEAVSAAASEVDAGNSLGLGTYLRKIKKA